MNYIPAEEASRRSRVVPPSIERKVMRWLDSIGANPLEHPSGVRKHNNDPTGLTVYISQFLEFNPKRLVNDFIEKVLPKTGYSVVDYGYEADGDGDFVIYLEYRIARTKEVEKPRYLYHATSSSLVKKIKKEGLKPTPIGPKDEEIRTYKNRVYLFTKPLNWEKSINTDLVGGVKGSDFAVFRIDTNIFGRFNIFVDAEGMNFHNPIMV